MSRPVLVYRLEVTHPQGSHDAKGHAVDGWEPPGWDDLAGKYNRYEGGDFMDGPPGPAQFSWPAPRVFLSRNGANGRAAMLRDFGATVQIQPSEPVTWSQS